MFEEWGFMAPWCDSMQTLLAASGGNVTVWSWGPAYHPVIQFVLPLSKNAAASADQRQALREGLALFAAVGLIDVQAFVYLMKNAKHVQRESLDKVSEEGEQPTFIEVDLIQHLHREDVKDCFWMKEFFVSLCCQLDQHNTSDAFQKAWQEMQLLSTATLLRLDIPICLTMSKCTSVEIRTEVMKAAWPGIGSGAKIMSSEDKESDWVDALIPGVGLCKIHRRDLVQCDHKPSRRPGAILTLQLGLLRPDGRLPELLRLVGSSLQCLHLKLGNDDNADPIFRDLSWVFAVCPHLLELTVRNQTLLAQYFVRAYNRSNARLRHLNCEFDDTRVVAAALCDDSTPLAQHLQWWYCCLDRSVPVVPHRESVEALESMLAVNTTLQYLTVKAKKREVEDFAATALEFDRVLQVFKDMRKDGFVVQPWVYAVALGAATQLQQKETIADIFRDLLANGERSADTGATQIEVKGESVQELLQDVRNRDVKLSDSVLRALARFAEDTTNPDVAMEVFAVMQNEGIQPPIESYTSMLVACAKRRRWSDVIKVYDAMPTKLKKQLHGKPLGSVIKAHTKSGNEELIQRGLDIFGQNRGKISSLVGNTAMEALLETGQFETVVALASDMKRQGVEFSKSTYNMVIRANIRSGSVEKARKLLRANASYLRNHSSEIYLELIKYYAVTRSDIPEACQVCSEMMQNSKLRLSDWYNALELTMKLSDSSLYWEIRKGMWIHAEVSESKLPAHLIQPRPPVTEDRNLLASQDNSVHLEPEAVLALEIYNKARTAGGEGLSQVLASRVLATMGKHNRVDDCVEMLSYFKQQDVSPKPYARVVAFRALHNARRFPDALAAVEDVIYDGSLENAWACAKALHIANLSCKHELVVEIFEHMQRKGMELSNDTYDDVIKSYSRVSEWEPAFKLLTRMQSTGPKPTIATYGWLLTALNKQDESRKVIEVYHSMPSELQLRLHGPVVRLVLMAHAAVEDEEHHQHLLKICNEHKAVCKEFPYQAALMALVESKQYTEAILLFDDMKTEKLKLSPMMYQTMVLAYFRSGAVDQARQLLQDNVKRLTNASAICYRELIHYYAEELKDVSVAAQLSVDMMRTNTRVDINDWRIALQLALQLPEHETYWELRRWMRLHGKVTQKDLPANLILSSPDDKQQPAGSHFPDQ
ncbi:hypothetical protein PHYBOEH_001113 [Phytophthora boehmeriae]|uniref:Pentatricopeptide repeat-containing protein-mitochondrial domain-containing protein n=1 Tax=Phytophthora boehmeriae TaxID=109152 RepID=A0A8T1WUM5_9STRA|nr:hypothetical protein PHYBOEH_001113 [Phytophthora boehmeriae]